MKSIQRLSANRTLQILMTRLHIKWYIKGESNRLRFLASLTCVSYEIKTSKTWRTLLFQDLDIINPIFSRRLLAAANKIVYIFHADTLCLLISLWFAVISTVHIAVLYEIKLRNSILFQNYLVTFEIDASIIATGKWESQFTWTGNRSELFNVIYFNSFAE